MDININTLNEIKNTGIVNDINNYVNVMNIISWQPKAIEQKLNDIRRQKELERLSTEEKRKREEQKKKRRENRERTFKYRLQEAKEKVKKSNEEIFLQNHIYLKKVEFAKKDKEFERGNFVRVPKNTDISGLSDYYYRFPMSYDRQGFSITLIKETFLRHVSESTMRKDTIEYYFSRGEVEIFLKVKEFLETRKDEEISTKEEYGQNVSR